jgi:flagellar hook-basal body complex protein FliE
MRQRLACFVQNPLQRRIWQSKCQIIVTVSLRNLESRIMTDRVDINRLLGDMRNLKAQTQAFQRPQGVGDTPNGMRSLGAVPVEGTTKAPSFGDLMTQAVNKVNDVQKTSNAMADAYERGVAGVDITDVMIASQKASVSFQAMVQVRNKLIDAYRDVMNMPI